MVTGQPGPGGWRPGSGVSLGGPPPALVSAARRPPEGGRTLVLDVGGQNVIVVLGEDGGEASLMWACIQKYLTGGKAIRM
jgi:hypothetical protein